MIRTYATFLFCVFKQMKMSELGSDASASEQYQFNYINLESTMSKLRISNNQQPNYMATVNLSDCRELMFPDFWRKTLSNPISVHKDAKNFTKKKLLNEILRPAKLKFPLINSPVPSSDKKSDEDKHVQNPSCHKLNEASEVLPAFINTNDNVPNSVSAELRMNGMSTPTIVTLPDFSSLSIRTASKKGVLTSNSKTSRFRPRPWKSNKSKSRFSSLKDYRSLRNALPPIPEVDADDDEQFLSSTDTSLTDLNISSNTNLQSVSALQSCSQQALMETNPCSDDITIDELASYLDVLVHIPKKMSPMAEMMYT